MTPTYWLVCEDRCALAHRRDKRHLLSNAIKHALLYEPQLLLSDSMFVTNRNLRALVAQSDTLRHAIKDEIVQCASRRAGRVKTLIEVRDDLVVANRHPLPSEFPSLEFRDNAALEFLQEHARIIPYDLVSIASRFTKHCKERFSSDAAEKLGREVGGCVLEYMESKAGSSDTKAIGFGDLYYRKTLGKHLDDRCGEGTWKRHSDVIRTIARGVYLTGIPDVLDTMAMFAKRHKKAVDVWRGRPTRRFQDTADPFSVSTMFNLSTYVKALESLRYSDIMALRESMEWSEYQKAKNADARLRPHKEIRDRYVALRHRIELTLARRIGRHNTGNPSRGVMRIGEIEGVAGGADWAAEQITEFVEERAFGFELVGLIRSILRPKKRLDPSNSGRREAYVEALEIERARSKVSRQEKRRPKGRVRSEYQYDQNNGYDTFVSAK